MTSFKEYYVCGQPVVASAKFSWNNLPISKIVEECGNARQKLFQKEFAIIDKEIRLLKFAIYAYEVKHESKFECGFISLNDGPLNCKLSINIKLGQTIVFEKNCTLKTFIGVHYFSFKKDGLLSNKLFKVSLDLEVSTDDKESINPNLIAQMNNPETSDLKIRCNGETFHVHRFIVRLRSGDLVKSDLDPSITIDEFSQQTVKSVIKYLYYECINVKEIDCNLLLAAHKYKIRQLFLICERHLSETLHTSDIPKTLSAATKVGSKVLLRSGIHWILVNKDDKTVRESWNEFCDQNPKVCIETTKMIDQLFDIQDITRHEVIEAENIHLYRYNSIPSMIELNVGYLASSPRILATMQNMRMSTN